VIRCASGHAWIFIRHGQSTGNVGLPSDALASIALTELGQQQAREVAADWAGTPTRIVTSPCLRTRQTRRRRSSGPRGCPSSSWSGSREPAKRGG